MSPSRKFSRQWILLALIGAILFTAVAVALVLHVMPRGHEVAPPLGGGTPSGAAPDPFQAVDQPTPSTPELNELRRIETRCIEMVRNVQPAVVGVISPSQAVRPQPPRHARGGTGVIISADGLVLSQLHVSHMSPPYKDFSDPHKPGEEAIVILADGQKCKAKLLGASRDYDLSLLQLSSPGPYPFVPLQADTKVLVGDWVAKLGHPLGFRKDRPAPVRLGRVLGSDAETFVSDAFIDGGDSGGPYFDLDGRLVGILNKSDPSLASELPREIPDGMDPQMIWSAINVGRIAALLESMKKGELSPDSRREPFMLSRAAGRRLPSNEWTQGAKTKGILASITHPLRSSVVSILNGGVPIALATVVDNEGLAVVKASDLPPSPQCRLPDGATVDVTVVGVDNPFDLAVIRIPPKSLRPIVWAERDTLPAGTMMAAVGLGGRPVACGVVSVSARKLADVAVLTYELPLRINVDEPEILGEAAKVGGGYSVLRTSGLAMAAGIKPGDRLISIAGHPITTKVDIANSVHKNRSGDVVSVELVRANKTMIIQLPLLPAVLDPKTTASASVATWRLDDFPIALEYSPPVETTECGGPLVDLSGRVIGITVGRSSKHAGWAIPAQSVRQIVDNAKNGKLSPWPTR